MGSIVGTIKDGNDHLLPGVEVTAIDENRGYTRSDLSKDMGDYEIDLLLEGTYSLTCKLPGFSTFTQIGIPVASRSVIRIDVRLEQGDASEQITLAAAAPIVASETSEVQVNSLSRQMVDGMIANPKLGRGQSAVLSSGRKNPTAGGLYEATTSTRIGGLETLQTSLTPDFINDIKVSYAGNKADQQSPLQVESSTLSGTNYLHGKLSVNLSNPALNSLGPTPLIKRDEGQTTNRIWHWDLSGPIYIPGLYDGRDRSFFWFGTNRTKSTRLPRSQSASFIPPLAWRDGDFSLAPADIYVNPSQTLINPANGAAFPGNKIDPSLIIPAARFLHTIYPEPNFGDGLVDPVHFVGKNYRTISVPGGVFNASKNGAENFKGDHKLTDNDQLGYTLTRNRKVNAWNFDGMGAWVLEQFSSDETHTGYWTHAFSTTVFNEFRLGRSHSKGGWGATPGVSPLGWRPIFDSGGFDALEKLGIPWRPSINPASRGANGLPRLCFEGIRSPLCATRGNQNESRRNRHVSTFIDNFSVRRGNHSIKIGGELLWKDQLFERVQAFGDFNYDGRFTGLSYADFLLGLPATVKIRAPAPPQESLATRQAVYFMNDWKVLSELTLELGVRFENHPTPREKNYRMLSFEPLSGLLVVPNQQAFAQISPNFPIDQNPVAMAAEIGLPELLRKHPQPYWYPRLGLAWRPFDNAKTVVRTGGGQFSAPIGLNGSLASDAPYVLDLNFDNALRSDGKPIVTQQAPIPSPGIASAPVPTQSVAGINPHFPIPYSHNWSLTIEQELAAHLGMRIAYLGAKVTHMPYLRNLNKPEPQSLLPYRSDCQGQVVSTCVGPIYPNFSRITFAEAGGNQTSHGLQLEVHQRWSAGLEFMVDYFWNKTLSDVRQASPLYLGKEIENPRDRSRDKGLSRSSVPHRLVVNHVWDLPFGKGMPWFNTSRLADYALGGWTLLGWWAWASPGYVSPVWVGADPSNTNSFSLRPDMKSGCDPNLQDPTVSKTFNRACFALPQAGMFGNAAYSSLRDVGPSLWGKTRFGLYKTFLLADILSEQGLSFRMGAEFDNPINHPYKRGIRSKVCVNCPGGDQTSMVGLRNVRLQLRLEF